MFALSDESSKQEALINAATGGYLESLEFLISKESEIPDSQKTFDKALMLAAEKGHADVVSILIKAGADVNAAFDHGGALSRAAKHQKFAVVNLLIRNGSAPG